jgi:hypothetical protein
VPVRRSVSAAVAPSSARTPARGERGRIEGQPDQRGDRPTREAKRRHQRDRAAAVAGDLGRGQALDGDRGQGEEATATVQVAVKATTEPVHGMSATKTPHPIKPMAPGEVVWSPGPNALTIR